LGQQQGPRQDYDPGRKHGPAGGGVQNPYTGAGIDSHLSPGHFCTQDLVWSLGAAPKIPRAGGGVHPEGPDFCQFRNWLLGCTKAGIAGTESGSEHAPQTNRKCTPGSGRGRAFAKRGTHQLNAIAFSTLKKFARPPRPIVADPGTSKQVKDVWLQKTELAADPRAINKKVCVRNPRLISKRHVRTCLPHLRPDVGCPQVFRSGGFVFRLCIAR
jgi:hypothetical protein